MTKTIKNDNTTFRVIINYGSKIDTKIKNSNTFIKLSHNLSYLIFT